MHPPPPHGPDSEIDPEQDENPSKELSAPLKGDSPEPSTWTLIAHDKKVLKGWARLARDTHENVVNAYDWLRKDAMKWKPGRCYPLRGEKHAGCWAYEIGSGDRLYYKPDPLTKTAKIYYAGPHPKSAIPAPPKEL